MLIGLPSMVRGAKMKHPYGVSKTGDQMDQEINSAPRAPEEANPAPPEKRDLVPTHQGRNLQTVSLAGKRVSRRWLRLALLLTIVIGGAGGGFYWWQHSQSDLPPGIAFGNGRIEALEIDIDTKFAGRISEILADAGDMVKAGQVVARMDTRDLSASLKKSQAAVLQAQQAINEADANVVQQTSLLLLGQQEFDRASALLQRGAQTQEVVDQRQETLDAANA